MKRWSMDFTNKEIEDYFISKLNGKFNYKLMVDDSYVNLGHKERYEFIILNEEKEFYINFMNFQTSVFIHNHELIFIDDDLKDTYTISDIYHNIVYEGEIKKMSHKDFLSLLFNIIIKLSDSYSMEIDYEPLTLEESCYPKYSYYIKVFTHTAEECECNFSNIKLKIININKFTA